MENGESESSADNEIKSVNDIVAPYHNLEYEKQLGRKANWLTKVDY